MIECVAMRMWIDYVQSASPPVEWHKSQDQMHWLNTATERDRQAWRRTAKVAIEAMRKPNAVMWEASGAVGIEQPRLEIQWERMIDAALL